MTESGYTAVPFPWERQMIIEGGRIASKRHTVFGLVEVDVTEANAYWARDAAARKEQLAELQSVLAAVRQALEEQGR